MYHISTGEWWCYHFNNNIKKNFILYNILWNCLVESILYLSSMNSSDPQWDKIEFKTWKKTLKGKNLFKFETAVENHHSNGYVASSMYMYNFEVIVFKKAYFAFGKILQLWRSNVPPNLELAKTLKEIFMKNEKTIGWFTIWNSTKYSV